MARRNDDRERDNEFVDKLVHINRVASVVKGVLDRHVKAVAAGHLREPPAGATYRSHRFLQSRVAPRWINRSSSLHGAWPPNYTPAM